MGIVLKDATLDSSWIYEGCTLKLLVWLTHRALKDRSSSVRFSRREAAAEIGESEWSVRQAFERLKAAGICRPDSTQPKKAVTVRLLGDYIAAEKDCHPDSTQIKGKKKASSPKTRPDSTQFSDAVTDSQSDGSDTSDTSVSPKTRPDSTQFEEKEISKESSPVPPIKKITKKKNVLTDGSADLPDGKPSLNVRAREVFELVYQELYGSAYYWNGKDAGQMSQLLNKIRFSRENRPSPLPVDDESLLGALRQFLVSIDKDWISNNFSVSKIASNYNEIISELKNKKKNARQINGTVNTADTRRASIVSNVSALDERWRKQNGTGSSDRQPDGTQ